MSAARCVLAITLIATCDTARMRTPVAPELAAAPSDPRFALSHELLPQGEQLAAAPAAPYGQMGRSALKPSLADLKPDPELLLVRGLGAFIYFVAFIVGLAAAGLLACCLYDLGRWWCHHSHFRACERKVRRVHNAFMTERAELPLCPCCVEPIAKQTSSTKVVFLCGHRFHISCANAWFRHNPANATKCPICVDPSEGPADLSSGPMDQELSVFDGGLFDDSLNFILKSLHRSYPEFISQAYVRRWAHCRTELWLQELSCPKYNSFMKQFINMECGVCGESDGSSFGTATLPVKN